MRFASVLLLSSLAPAATPHWFEPNRGQVAGRTQWIARSGASAMYITGSEVVFAMPPEKAKPGERMRNVHMRLAGSTSAVRFEGLEPLGSYSNYFVGRTEKEWFTGVPHYARVRYDDVYPGISMVWYSKGRDVEFDFDVSPGADPNRIELAFSEPVKLDRGDLVVAGLRMHRPRVLQDGAEIQATYRISGNRVQFALREYDRTRALLVDPVLEFSTYFGGPGDESTGGVAVDRAGFVYLAGSTQSPAAPVLDPFQQPNVVALAPFVMKLTPTGDRIVWFTILGSGGWDGAKGLALDSNGNVVIAGQTRSPNFPIKNAFQPEFKASFDNAFVSKLSTDGRSLLFSTYLGGTGWEQLWQGPAVDAGGNAYVFGWTSSRDFPLRNAVQTRYSGGEADCFLTKFSPEGAPLFSTLFGGSGWDICRAAIVSPAGGVVIAGATNTEDFPLKNATQVEISSRGRTPFLARFDGDGQLVSSTFIGGPTYGFAAALAADSAGNIYVGGDVYDSKFETRNAYQSQFLSTEQDTGFFMKLTPDARTVLAASYLGGSGNAWVDSIAVGQDGSIYMSGGTASADFPSKDSLQPFRGGGLMRTDCYLAKFDALAKSLLYSTFFGGTNQEHT